MRGVLRLEPIRCVAAFAVAAMLAACPAPAAAEPRDDRTFAGAVNAMIRLLVQPVPPPMPLTDRHSERHVVANNARRKQATAAAYHVATRHVAPRHIATRTVAPPIAAPRHIAVRAISRVAVVPLPRVPAALRVLSAERGDVICRGVVMQCRSGDQR